ncbi:hypothetical protein BDZ89DRAFT_1068317 [Hymenopellis radicata]|nr:hypothetical protein BDZ89DRAFT_1068317 [Hymenopellis radicata]
MSKASLSKDPQPITPSCPEDRQHSSPPTTKPSFLPSSPAKQSSVLSCKPKPTTPSVVAQPPHTLTLPQVFFPAAKRIRDSPPVTPLLSHPPSKRHKVCFQEYFANPRGSSNENVLSKLPEDVSSSTNDNTAKQPTVEDIVFSEVISNKSTAQRQGSSVSLSMPTKEKITHVVSTNTDSDGLGKPLEPTRKAADVMIAAKRRFLYTRMNIFDITTDWEPSPPRTGRVEREEGEGAIEYLARRGLL